VQQFRLYKGVRKQSKFVLAAYSLYEHIAIEYQDFLSKYVKEKQADGCM
jgi:hypothetical protein